jgi:hypothetical protein
MVQVLHQRCNTYKTGSASILMRRGTWASRLDQKSVIKQVSYKSCIHSWDIFYDM